jgi:hypothetical protein
MDVTLDVDAAGGVAVKLQGDEWEVNFRASRDELMALSGIRYADWNERRSIRAGKAAGAPVFWASGGSDATLMIGSDDETWDVAITLPVAAVEDIASRGLSYFANPS